MFLCKQRKSPALTAVGIRDASVTTRRVSLGRELFTRATESSEPPGEQGNLTPAYISFVRVDLRWANRPKRSGGITFRGKRNDKGAPRPALRLSPTDIRNFRGN